MKKRSPLIGFTEAELGFVVAAIVAFTAAAEMPATAKRGNGLLPPPVGPTVDTATAPHSPPSPVVVSETLPDSMSRTHKRNCYEVREQTFKTSPVDVIEIDAVGQFRLGAESLTADALNVKLTPFEIEAKSNKCRYTLQFRAADSIPYRQVLVAERVFSARFYIQNR